MLESLRRAGQRVVIGFDGHTASPDLKRLVHDYQVGGVILFARNVDGPEQVADLVREIQSTARDAGHVLPLLVGVDQEGGRVARLREPWTVWPPLRALGRSGSAELARRMGAGLAAELAACGIRWDLAPVVDVDTNPKNPVIGDRSFGDDPELVGRLGAAMIRGLQDGGVIACAKHFPGHGDSDLDSHLALPVLDHPRARLQDVELRPFRRAIEAEVGTIMTGHLLVRELDDEAPATLSRRVLDELLRREMKYAGVVASDDLEMKAVADRWPPGEAAVLAAKAGCDLILVCASHDKQAEAVEALVRMIEEEKPDFALTLKENAEDRIRRLKQRFLVPYRNPDPRQARLAAGMGERRDLSHEIAERGGVAV